MNFLTNRLLRRFGPAGRLADAAIVGGAALKFARRRGLVSEDTARKFGAADSSAGASLSVGELVLVLMAAVRLIRQFSKKRASSPERVTIIEV